MHNRIRLAIDIDGVIRNFIKTVEKIFKKYHPSLAQYVTPVNNWDLKKHYPGNIDIYDFIFREHPSEIMFENAFDYDNEVENEIMLADKYYIALVTSQTPTTIEPTLKYIMDRGLVYDSIHFVTATNKEIVDADFYIDDSPHIIQELLDAGKTVFAMIRPWNYEVIYKNFGNKRLLGIDTLASVDKAVKAYRE